MRGIGESLGKADKKFCIAHIGGMKTAIIVAVTAMATCGIFCGELTDFVCGYEGIEQAYCVVYDDIALVAAKTQPFFTRSEKEAFREKLTEDIKEKFGYREVVVSTDSDIFYLAKKACESGLSEEELERLLVSGLKRAGLI